MVLSIISDVPYLQSLAREGNSNLLVGDLVTDYSSQMAIPTSYLSEGYEVESGNKFGWMLSSSAPFLYSSNVYADACIASCLRVGAISRYEVSANIRHYVDKEYRWSP